MKVLKQFIDHPEGICRLLSDEDCFVPEMSLPVKDILAQFAFVDNMRLAEYAKHGYDVANEDDEDFDVLDPDSLDLAEREELYDESKEVLNQAKSRAKKAQPTTPQE